jgi:hypothetical protein
MIDILVGADASINEMNFIREITLPFGAPPAMLDFWNHIAITGLSLDHG